MRPPRRRKARQEERRAAGRAGGGEDRPGTRYKEKAEAEAGVQSGRLAVPRPARPGAAPSDSWHLQPGGRGRQPGPLCRVGSGRWVKSHAGRARRTAEMPSQVGSPPGGSESPPAATPVQGCQEGSWKHSFGSKSSGMSSPQGQRGPRCIGRDRT